MKRKSKLILRQIFFSYRIWEGAAFSTDDDLCELKLLLLMHLPFALAHNAFGWMEKIKMSSFFKVVKFDLLFFPANIINDQIRLPLEEVVHTIKSNGSCRRC